ncbi:MAG: hypothetical protein GX020_00030 [Firmicutes bacterium]|nr:hypothetical protein [Bacillota bacterium]
MKINLLPPEDRMEAPVGLRVEFLIGVLAIIIFLTITGLTFIQHIVVDNLKFNYQQTMDLWNTLERQKQELDTEKSVINELQEQSMFLADILNEANEGIDIAKIAILHEIPIRNLWFESWEFDRSSSSIRGYGYNLETIIALKEILQERGFQILTLETSQLPESNLTIFSIEALWR